MVSNVQQNATKIRNSQTMLNSFMNLLKEKVIAKKRLILKPNKFYSTLSYRNKTVQCDKIVLLIHDSSDVALLWHLIEANHLQDLLQTIRIANMNQSTTRWIQAPKKVCTKIQSIGKSKQPSNLMASSNWMATLELNQRFVIHHSNWHFCCWILREKLNAHHWPRH